MNLVEATAEAAAGHDRRYLLLSSSTTRRTGLYHEALRRRGVRFFDVDDDDQLEVDEIVHTVMADDLESAGAQIDELVGRLEGGDPFDGIIAACTELPIAFDHSEVSSVIPVIDSNRVLAQALVDTYFAMRRAGRVPVPAG